MNREQAKKEVIFKLNNKHSEATLVQFVDTLYDDFESLICKNCKHYDNEDPRFISDWHKCELGYGDDNEYGNVLASGTYGCSRWEAK